MPEVHHAAARHGISATEGREEKSLQQGVLLGVLVDRGALEAVDGGHMRCVQHHLLRVALLQRLVRSEDEDEEEEEQEEEGEKEEEEAETKEE